MSQIFGEPWDAPVCEGATRVPTPIGHPCGWCGVLFGLGDRGVATGVPMHRECQLRAVVGSPAHLRGECSCVVGRGAEPAWPATPAEMRAEALEVWQTYTAGQP